MFRHEYTRLVAILVRQLGPSHLPLVEDVVQDALLRAAQIWPYRGLPPQPTAWLLTTARNRAMDLCRRDNRWQKSAPKIAHQIELTADHANDSAPAAFEDEIRDASLRMMFVCCHPGLTSDAQLALILKTLVGFGENEIAAAFLVPRATITKRLVRARKYLRDCAVQCDLPDPSELDARIGTVRHALYLLFNEGYKASAGENLVRDELCAEAMRLLDSLLLWPSGRLPANHALAALMCFHGARFSTRTDINGEAVLLAHQDRSRWNRTLIRRGIDSLQKSAAGDELTRYHIEAGIASAHCLAPSYSATDWSRIVGLYEQLKTISPSPFVSLNHAVALSETKGPQVALALIDQEIDSTRMKDYHLYHAVRAHLLQQLGSPEAGDALQRAEALAPIPAERRSLRRRAEKPA